MKTRDHIDRLAGKLLKNRQFVMSGKEWAEARQMIITHNKAVRLRKIIFGFSLLVVAFLSGLLLVKFMADEPVVAKAFIEGQLLETEIEKLTRQSDLLQAGTADEMKMDKSKNQPAIEVKIINETTQPMLQRDAKNNPVSSNNTSKSIHPADQPESHQDDVLLNLPVTTPSASLELSRGQDLSLMGNSDRLHPLSSLSTNDRINSYSFPFIARLKPNLLPSPTPWLEMKMTVAKGWAGSSQVGIVSSAFSYGVTYNLPVSAHWIVQPAAAIEVLNGLNYQEETTTRQYGFGSKTTTLRRITGSLIYASSGIGFGRQLSHRLSAIAGFGFKYLLNSRSRMTESHNSILDPASTKSYYSFGYNDGFKTFATHVNAGMSYRLNAWFSAGVDIQIGLSDLVEDSYFDVVKNDREQLFKLSISYRIK